MNMMIRVAVVCCLGLISAREAFAADAGPVMAKPGKLLFEDNFARADMKPNWKVGKGHWSIKDGVVSAEEIPADKHGAYAYIDPNIEYKDVIADFSFKLDGAKNLHLNMRDSKYKGSHAGHILEAMIFPDHVRLVDMKLGNMKMENYEKTSDPKTTPEEKKAIGEKIKDKAANYKISIDLSAWHTARVEVVGDEMVMSIDGKPVGYLKSEGIDHATKNMLGFTIGGQSAEIKNVKFTAATAQPDWASRRAEVVGNMPK